MFLEIHFSQSMPVRQLKGNSSCEGLNSPEEQGEHEAWQADSTREPTTLSHPGSTRALSEIQQIEKTEVLAYCIERHTGTLKLLGHHLLTGSDLSLWSDCVNLKCSCSHTLIPNSYVIGSWLKTCDTDGPFCGKRKKKRERERTREKGRRRSIEKYYTFQSGPLRTEESQKRLSE